MKREQPSRTVPLFPEVRECLDPLWESADEGQVLILPRHQVTGSALKKELTAVCEKLKIPTWKKPWQNMRATRETELTAEGHPIHNVCHWLGNSPSTALKHYNQVSMVITASDAARATRSKRRSKPTCT